MAHVMDSIVTGAILITALYFAAKFLWKIVHPPKHMNSTCIACDSGCDMKEIRNDYHKKKHQLQVSN